MKARILSLIISPVGLVFKAIVASTIGTILGNVYHAAWVQIYKVPWLLSFVDQVTKGISPEIISLMTPTVIGVGCAAIVWGCIEQWATGTMKEGNKEIQQKIINSDDLPNVEKDGIILPGGETSQAVKLAIHGLRK